MIDAIQFSLPQLIILWGIPLLFAITVHEVAHGWMANKLGDPTARMLGRLTLNPIKHIDLFGTIILPAAALYLSGFLFGWAKPVPINWRNLHHTRRDIALVAVAGPMANFIMALLWACVAKLGMIVGSHNINLDIILRTMGKVGIYVNIMLMLVNLLPIQPLDGGRVLSSVLPRKLSYYFDRLERYGIFILLILVVTGLLGYILSEPFYVLTHCIQAIWGLPR